MKYRSDEDEFDDRSRIATITSVAACSLFLILLIAMHWVRTDLDPTRHFISEYENGRLGWVMQLAFICMAMAHFGLIARLWSWLACKLGRAGIGMLFLAGVSLLMAGLFKADPAQTPPDLATLTGSIHNAAGALGLTMTFAVALVTLALRRTSTWRDRLWIIQSLAIGAILSSVVTIIAFGLYLSGPGGAIGPDAPLGIFNRLEIVAYTAWFLSVAIVAAGMNSDRRTEACD